MASTAISAVQDLLSNDKKKDVSDAIEPKDFFWDQFHKYVSSAILALTVLNVSVDLLRDGGVVCFPPPDTDDLLTNKLIYEFGRDQAKYLNNYCARSVPITEYFPIYILVHGIFLIAPHYIWNAVNKGDFDSFFAIAEKFDRLRDYKTGEYPEQNFDRVTKLEFEYGGTRRKIFFFYLVKLCSQLCVCVGSVIFSSIYFTEFSFSFNCPRDLSENSLSMGWPLNITVPCVYSSLRILSLIRYADFILVAIAGVLSIYGLAWCFLRHTGELGHIEIARFQFQSGLTADNFIFPSVISWPSHQCCCCKDKKKKHRPPFIIWVFTHYPRIRNVFSPRIKSDFDFLIMRLFRADLSHGKVFRDIQVNKELKRLIGRDHQLLHLYINIQNNIRDKQWIPLTKKSPRQRKEEKDNGCCGYLRRVFGCEPRRSGRRTRTQMVEGPESDVSLQTQTTTNRGPSYTNPSYLSAQESLESSDSDSDGGSERGEDWLEETDNADLKGATKDFHQIFLDSGFTCNPEKHAFNYFKAFLGNVQFFEEDFSGFRDCFYWFFQFLPTYKGYASRGVPDGVVPRNDLALDVSFGSHGFALVLARAFKMVMSLNFHPYFRNCDQIANQEAFYTNHVTFTLPENIYTQADKKLTKATKLVFDYVREGPAVGRTFDFILVGPIVEEAKIVSVNLLIDNLCTVDNHGYIGEEALLIAVRPLKVGSRKLTQYYHKFKPSEQLFRSISKTEVLPKLRKAKGVKIRRVDNIRGIEVNCGAIPCVFEFAAYRYKMQLQTPQPDYPEQGDKNREGGGEHDDENPPSAQAHDNDARNGQTQVHREGSIVVHHEDNPSHGSNERQRSMDSGVFSPVPGKNAQSFVQAQVVTACTTLSSSPLDNGTETVGVSAPEVAPQAMLMSGEAKPNATISSKEQEDEVNSESSC